MAVIKVYNRINWLNKSESLTTPLGKTNLNKMDKAIDTIDNEVVSISATAESLDTTKADKDQLNNMITDISVNDKNGVISITKYNGTVLNIDTAMEKIAVNFEYNAQTQQLILTLENGKKQYIDMSALITQYEFKDTDTIAFSIDSSGKVSASIKSGSITKAMLSSEVMSAITLSENNAAASAQAAAQSATNSELDSKMSQSYAVGKSGIRDGEDTDNSKYYSEQAKNYADKAQQATKQIEVDSELSETSTNPVENKAINAEIDNLQLQINDIEQNDTLAHNSIHTSIDKVSQQANITRGTLTQWQEQGRIPNGIVNNLVTTASGYAIDARQLNKSVENSFAYEIDKSISAINDSLTTLKNESIRQVSRGDANSLVGSNGKYFMIWGANCPENHGFLDTQCFNGVGFTPNGEGGGAPLTKQVFTAYGNANTYVRMYMHAQNNFTAWNKLN